MRHHDRLNRRLARSALSALALAGLLLGTTGMGTAVAQTTVETLPGQSCPDKTGVATAKVSQELMPGVKVGPALITSPGKPSRTLTADQATAFLQSWLPSSVYTQIAPDAPPDDVPVYQLEMNNAYAGSITCVVAWYARQGDSVWVGMPKQTLGWASVQNDTWIPAPLPAKSISAFAGNEKPVAGFASPSTTTTVPGEPTAAGETGSGDDSSSNTLLWILVAGVVAVGGIGIFLLARGRAVARDAEPEPEPELASD